MRLAKFIISMSIAAIAATASSSLATANEKGLDNPRRAPYFDAVNGKKVVFVPMAMGFDLTEAWAAVWRKQASRMGYSFEIRDPNWNVDAGARAIQQIITETPDILIAHNTDIQSYSRLLKQAEAAGIKVIQVNMEAVTQTDAYVGTDWVEIGELGGKALVEKCGGASNTSKKIAIIQGSPTSAADVYQMRGLYNILDQNPDIQVVSQQAASFDPSKARSIMTTILQQTPDLCGVYGIWDSQDTGIGAAIEEAGKSDQIFLVTSGGGNKTACDNVNNGLFDMVTTYSAPVIAAEVNQMIAELLQSKEPAGSRRLTYFTPLLEVTKANATPYNCWTMDDLK